MPAIGFEAWSVTPRNVEVDYAVVDAGGGLSGGGELRSLDYDGETIARIYAGWRFDAPSHPTVGVVFSLNKVPLKRRLDALTAAPARILGLKGKGKLVPGADADLTLIDPKASWKVDASKFKTKGRSTPFDGMKFTGLSERVIVGGRVCS